MEVIESTIPILYTCRLCLSYSKDCIEITNQLYAVIRNHIRKYLNLEVISLKLDERLLLKNNIKNALTPQI